MGLSVASLSPVSSVMYAAPKSETTAISNQSAVSDSYRESLGMRTSPESITGAPPVQYAQRRTMVPVAENITANQRANRAYNDIAFKFNGNITSYGSDSMGQSYATPGSMVDLFA